MSITAEETFEQWSILELMGHVRIAGRVTEEERFGVKMGRIDVPGPDGTFTTQYFGGGSVYRMTPTTEEIARAVAANSTPEPVHRWELPEATPRRSTVEDLTRDYDDTESFNMDNGYARDLEDVEHEA